MGKRKSQGSSADEELFEVDRIKARKLENGHPVYLIACGRATWTKSTTHDTWEPLCLCPTWPRRGLIGC